MLRWRYLLVCLFVVLPVLRAIIWTNIAHGFWHHDPALWKRQIYEPIHTHSDGLIMGLTIANVLSSGKAGSERTQIILSYAMILLAIAASVVLQKFQREVFAFTSIILVMEAITWLMLILHENSFRLEGLMVVCLEEIGFQALDVDPDVPTKAEYVRNRALLPLSKPIAGCAFCDNLLYCAFLPFSVLPAIPSSGSKEACNALLPVIWTQAIVYHQLIR